MDYIEILRTIFLNPIKLGIVTLPFTLLDLCLRFVIPLFLIFILIKLANKATKGIVDKTKLKEVSKTAVKKWTKLGLRLVFLSLVFILAGRLFGAQMLKYLKIFYQTLNQPIFNLGGTKISIVTLLMVLPIFYLASWTGKAVGGIANQTFMEKLGFDEARQFSLLKLLRYTVMTITFLIGLSVIGINLSSITVIFGVLGLGLGFGLQNSVANLFAGLLIILTRPVKEGDSIFLNNYEGSIDEIRAFSTVITTIRNETIIVPNSQFVSEVVYNYSYDDRSIIIQNNIGVSYDSDIDKVIDVLEKIASDSPYRRGDKDPTVLLKEFADSSINLAVLTWIKDVKDKYPAEHWINLEIWRAFKREGIEIPFPQSDVHIKQAVSGSSRQEHPEET